MSRLAAPSLLFLAIACDRGGLSSLEDEVTASPARLDFGAAFIGYPVERTLALTNRSKADRTVALDVAAPFSTPEATAVVPGGAELDVTVRFAPTQEGPAAGRLFGVELSGTGVAPPTCETAATCLASTFDPPSGACVEAPLAGGTACTDACVTNGACMGGKCKGAALGCADTDACTVDACEPALGCVHVPLQCGAATNPCKVAGCDPALGCVETDARDGTPCGPADCTTAQVCLLGQCQSAAVPNGARCGEASPCQAAGSCQQNTCVRPAATQLTEAWHYDFPSSLWSFEGITDANQNLYWIECAPTCAAVSYSRDGLLRFRTPLPTTAKPMHMVRGDQLVWAVGDQVGALATAGGASRWTVTLPLALPGAPDTASTMYLGTLFADSSGVLLTIGRYQGTTPQKSAVLKVSPSDGALSWVRFFDPYISGATVDELDSLYFRAGADLVSLSAAGVERWRVASGVPIAAFNGEVLLESGEVRATSDGALKAAAPAGRLWSSPVMSLDQRTLLREPSTADRVNAIALTPAAQTPSWETLVTMLHATTVTKTVATKSGDVLLAAGGTRHPYVLHAIDRTGAERYACELPIAIIGTQVLQPVAFVDGRWAMVEGLSRLRVFEVPGELPATRGWAAARGSGAGTRRPLP